VTEAEIQERANMKRRAVTYMRENGMTFKEIASEIGLSINRARSIYEIAARRKRQRKPISSEQYNCIEFSDFEKNYAAEIVAICDSINKAAALKTVDCLVPDFVFAPTFAPNNKNGALGPV